MARLSVLALALVGLNGMLSKTVTRRSHGIGIRMALGADRDRILGSVLAQACTMTIVGVLIGGAFAAAGIRVMIHGLLYGIVAQGAGELPLRGHCSDCRHHWPRMPARLARWFHR